MWMNPKVYNALRLDALHEADVDCLMFVMFGVKPNTNPKGLCVTLKKDLWNLLEEQYLLIKESNPERIKKIAGGLENICAFALEYGYPRKYVPGPEHFDDDQNLLCDLPSKTKMKGRKKEFEQKPRKLGTRFPGSNVEIASVTTSEDEGSPPGKKARTEDEDSVEHLFIDSEDEEKMTRKEIASRRRRSQHQKKLNAATSSDKIPSRTPRPVPEQQGHGHMSPMEKAKLSRSPTLPAKSPAVQLTMPLKAEATSEVDSSSPLKPGTIDALKLQLEKFQKRHQGQATPESNEGGGGAQGSKSVEVSGERGDMDEEHNLMFRDLFDV